MSTRNLRDIGGELAERDAPPRPHLVETPAPAAAAPPGPVTLTFQVDDATHQALTWHRIEVARSIGRRPRKRGNPVGLRVDELLTALVAVLLDPDDDRTRTAVRVHLERNDLERAREQQR